MSTSCLTAVITTIQPATPSVRGLLDRLQAIQGNLLVIGDKKGPASFDEPGAEFVPLTAQLALPYRLAALLPTGHYARKNLGYLLAISRKAPCIYETDDDNAPNQAWTVRSEQTTAQRLTSRKWANVYRLFQDDLIWPRGFPLNRVNDPATHAHDRQAALEAVTAPIQQGLADLSPDVDAAWRLLLDREFKFAPYQSVWLPPGTWCPFNSQTTWWWPVAYPLLYLPSYCSFRMTDIWRSFVAQRCLWELGCGLVFHPPEVVQQRNVHNLMRDFEDEVPGYLRNEAITDTLAGLSLKPGAGEVANNMQQCWTALVEGGFLPGKELPLVEAWRADLREASA